MTAQAYVVTDLHPPKRARWLTRERAWRFAKADMVALWMVTRFCARHLTRFLDVRTGRDGAPVWFHIVRALFIGWMLLGLLHLAAETPGGLLDSCPTRASTASEACP